MASHTILINNSVDYYFGVKYFFNTILIKKTRNKTTQSLTRLLGLTHPEEHWDIETQGCQTP